MELELVQHNLMKKGYVTRAFPTAGEATDYLDAQIDGVSVGIGGSETVREMGLYDRLKSHNNVWWNGDAQVVKDVGIPEISRQGAAADVYISSVNGMSTEGQLINIDNTGNRIASTAFGHKKVYLVIGKNKIEDTLEKAYWRARNIAAPRNAQRLGRKTPCAVKGDKCYDCKSVERICRGFLIIEAPMKGVDTEIILIDEALGY